MAAVTTLVSAATPRTAMPIVNRFVATTLGVVAAGVTILLISLAGVLAAIGLLGATPVVVTGGSMAPAIPLGSLAVAVPVSAPPQQGDVVTFSAPNGTYVTHRVTGTAPGNPGAIVTKGDANQHPDPQPTPVDEVIGLVTVSLPLVGFGVAMVQTPSGVLALASLVASIVTARRALLLPSVRGQFRPVSRQSRHASALLVIALVWLQPAIPSTSLLSDSASVVENEFTTGSW